MKKNIFIALLVWSFNAFAQTSVEYANFIQTDTAVKWAAISNSYLNLTPVNPNFDLRYFFLQKLKAGAIKVYKSYTARFAVFTDSLNYQQFIAGIKKATFDSIELNRRDDIKYDNLFRKETNSCDTCMLANKHSIFKVKQLLYYKDHRLQLRNILLTPVIYTKQSGEHKEDAVWYEAPAVAFNDLSEDADTIPKIATYIGRSTNELVLQRDLRNADETNVLNSRYGDLYGILRNEVAARKIKAYAPYETDKYGKKKLLNSKDIYALESPTIEFSVYDTLGNVIGMKYMRNEASSDSSYHFLLTQDLYFDFQTQKLYSNPLSFFTMRKVVTPQGLDLGTGEFWGVVFPEKKRTFIKKTK